MADRKLLSIRSKGQAQEDFRKGIHHGQHLLTGSDEQHPGSNQRVQRSLRNEIERNFS